MDALTKAFVLCYDERPENPIERLVEVVADNAKILGASSELKSRLINTELELKHARTEIEVLRKQLTDLGVTPVSVPSYTSASSSQATNTTGNGPTISTLSAEAEKTVPSSNTSAVDAATHTVNTGAIPKTPQPAPTTAATTTTENAASESTTTDAATNSSPSSNTNNTSGAKTEETTSGQTQVVTAATNTEESATKEAAT